MWGQVLRSGGGAIDRSSTSERGSRSCALQRRRSLLVRPATQRRRECSSGSSLCWRHHEPPVGAHLRRLAGWGTHGGDRPRPLEWGGQVNNGQRTHGVSCRLQYSHPCLGDECFIQCGFASLRCPSHGRPISGLQVSSVQVGQRPSHCRTESVSSTRGALASTDVSPGREGARDYEASAPASSNRCPRPTLRLPRIRRTPVTTGHREG